MPRKKGTALGRVKRDMPPRKKLQIALHGSQAFNPHWKLACVLRLFALNNLKGKDRVNLGDDATVTGSAEDDKSFGLSVDKLRREVFCHVVGAVSSKDSSFFERMAEAIHAGKEFWRYQPDKLDDKWEASDPLLFEILEAREALSASGKKVIRPIDIWAKLSGNRTFESVRDRITRYAVPGIYTGKGRPKVRKQSMRRSTLKELKETFRSYKKSGRYI